MSCTENRKWFSQLQMKPIGIVIATRWEARELLRRFGFSKVESNLYEARARGRRLLLMISGVGMEAARRASGRLIAAGAGELISMGFCGALVPELRVGDVVRQRIATSRSPVRTRDERLRITQRANAIAVDMESQAVIEAGTLGGVPIRMLRVVSDRLDDDLTPLFGSDDEFCASKIALRLLSPKTWPLAARLKKNSAIAKTRLADALAEYLH